MVEKVQVAEDGLGKGPQLCVVIGRVGCALGVFGVHNELNSHWLQVPLIPAGQSCVFSCLHCRCKLARLALKCNVPSRAETHGPQDVQAALSVGKKQTCSTAGLCQHAASGPSQGSQDELPCPSQCPCSDCLSCPCNPESLHYTLPYKRMCSRASTVTRFMAMLPSVQKIISDEEKAAWE